MPDGISDFGAGAWLSALFGVTADITGYYVALCNAEPGVASDGTILADLEPVDGAYARQAYGVGALNWAVNGNYLVSLAEIGFGFPTIDWGLITHYAMLTDDVDGDLYAWGEFANPEYVTAGYEFTIPEGGVVLSLASQDNSITL